jgi:hypothetical protein
MAITQAAKEDAILLIDYSFTGSKFGFARYGLIISIVLTSSFSFSKPLT